MRFHRQKKKNPWKFKSCFFPFPPHSPFLQPDPQQNNGAFSWKTGMFHAVFLNLISQSDPPFSSVLSFLLHLFISDVQYLWKCEGCLVWDKTWPRSAKIRLEVSLVRYSCPLWSLTFLLLFVFWMENCPASHQRPGFDDKPSMSVRSWGHRSVTLFSTAAAICCSR